MIARHRWFFLDEIVRHASVRRRDAGKMSEARRSGERRDDSETSRCKDVQNAAFNVGLGVNNLLIAGYWVEPSLLGLARLNLNVIAGGAPEQWLQC